MIPDSQRTVSTARISRLIHASMVAGLLFMAVTLYVVRRVATAQALTVPIVGPVLGGVALVLLTVAAAAVRPRIAARRFDQNADDYWSGIETRTAAILLWGIAEGAGLVGCVGYFLTGATAPAVAVFLALVMLTFFRPSRLEGEGSSA